jgi:FKBP-type peptidyl-prolyl cis-trans isomerase (trigger factor)
LIDVTDAPAAPAAPADPAESLSPEVAAAPAPSPPAEKEDTVEFEVGDERVWDELSLAVSGLAAGQEAAFSREAPLPAPAGADASAATANRPRRFKIRVSAVKERELPALDDELAARVNPELGGLSELRQMVERRLREARIDERDELRQRALFDQLRERHPMELPQGVVQREVEHLANDYGESLVRRGVRPEQLGLDWQRVREEVRPVAERRVHVRLLLDAIAEAEPVVVTDEEFERALAALARAQKTTTPALRKALDENGRLAALRAQMRRDKTVRHLLGETPAAAGHAADAADAAHGADTDSEPPNPANAATPATPATPGGRRDDESAGSPRGASAGPDPVR